MNIINDSKINVMVEDFVLVVEKINCCMCGNKKKQVLALAFKKSRFHIDRSTRYER